MQAFGVAVRIMQGKFFIRIGRGTLKVALARLATVCRDSGYREDPWQT